MAVICGAALRPVLQRALSRVAALVLFWLRARSSQTLWRLSGVPWQKETAREPLAWLQAPCSQCEAWGERWQRLHAALHHIAKPPGSREPDRCCSATGHAAIAVRRAIPEEAAACWLHRIRAPPAAVAWDCRALSQEAATHGFALGDFASSCLKRRDAADYANRWGVKLQEVLLDRCQLDACSVASIRLEELVERWPDALRQAQKVGGALRRCLAEQTGEATPRPWDLWLQLPLQRLHAELHHVWFQWKLEATLRTVGKQ